MGASPGRDENDDDIWMALGVTLAGCNRTVRNSWWCPDAIGIGFNPNDWAVIGEPVGHAGKDHSYQFTADDVAEDALAGTVNINNHVDYIDPSVCRALPRTGASLTGGVPPARRRCAEHALGVLYTPSQHHRRPLYKEFQVATVGCLLISPWPLRLLGALLTRQTPRMRSVCE